VIKGDKKQLKVIESHTLSMFREWVQGIAPITCEPDNRCLTGVQRSGFTSDVRLCAGE
jgi:hypothetical protein